MSDDQNHEDEVEFQLRRLRQEQDFREGEGGEDLPEATDDDEPASGAQDRSSGNE